MLEGECGCCSQKNPLSPSLGDNVVLKGVQNTCSKGRGDVSRPQQFLVTLLVRLTMMEVMLNT
jgi:hypothetical protein